MTFKPREDDRARIKAIGRSVMAMPPGRRVAVCVDADDGDEFQGKGDWYEKQFRLCYPAVIIERRYDGPTPGVHTIILESPPFRRRGPSEN